MQNSRRFKMGFILAAPSLVLLGALTFIGPKIASLGSSVEASTSKEIPVDKNDFDPKVLAAEFTLRAAQAQQNLNSAEPTIQDAHIKLTPDQVVVGPEVQTALNDRALGYQVIAMVNLSEGGTTPSSQTITVFKREGNHFNYLYRWPVSTGHEIVYGGHTRHSRPGFYRAEYLNEHYVSGAYKEAMPYSVFYDRDFGTAIHETSADKYVHLGHRASMGCTRLNHEHAKAFFDLVSSYPLSAVVNLNPFPESLLAEANVGEASVVYGEPVMIINTNPNPNDPIMNSNRLRQLGGARVTVNPDDYVNQPDRLFELFKAGTSL